MSATHQDYVRVLRRLVRVRAEVWLLREAVWRYEGGYTPFPADVAAAIDRTFDAVDPAAREPDQDRSHADPELERALGQPPVRRIRKLRKETLPHAYGGPI